MTVRHTDVSNSSEQTPLPSNSHRHTLLNKRQTIHTHLCSPWHYICNTSPLSFCPLQLLWLHCMRDALSFITPPPTPPSTPHCLHPAPLLIHHKKTSVSCIISYTSFSGGIAYKPSSQTEGRLQGHCKLSSTLSQMLLSSQQSFSF